jgi:hypothetical protein
MRASSTKEDGVFTFRTSITFAVMAFIAAGDHAAVRL